MVFFFTCCFLGTTCLAQFKKGKNRFKKEYLNSNQLNSASILEHGVKELRGNYRKNDTILVTHECSIDFKKDSTLYELLKKLKSLKDIYYTNHDAGYDIERYIQHLPFPDSITFLEYTNYVYSSEEDSHNLEKLINLRTFWIYQDRMDTIFNSGFDIGRYRINDGLEDINITTESYTYINPSLTKYKQLNSIFINSNTIDSIPNCISEIESLKGIYFGNSLYEVNAGRMFKDSLNRLNIFDYAVGGIRYLPKDIGQLKKLESFDCFSCPNLYELPLSFANLNNLTSVTFKDCISLKYFPEQLLNLKSLQQFYMDDLVVELLKKSTSQGQNPSVKSIYIYRYYNAKTRKFASRFFIKKLYYKHLLHRHFPNAKIYIP